MFDFYVCVNKWIGFWEFCLICEYIYICLIFKFCIKIWYIFICLMYEYVYINDCLILIFIMEDKRIVLYIYCLKYDIDW